MTKEAASFINETIRDYAAGWQDGYAGKVVERTGKTPIELARKEVYKGHPTGAASFLQLDTETPVVEKGGMFADTLTKASIRQERIANMGEGELSEKYAERAEQTGKVATKLWAAVDTLKHS